MSLNRFDAAILDVNLYTETSFAIAEDLQDRKIPFVFATGYGETIVVPDRFKGVFVVSKPYIEDVLRAALAALIGNDKKGATRGSPARFRSYAFSAPDFLPV